MKIAIAGGHSRKAPGAKGYLDEYECDRAFVAKLIPALKAAGHTVVDCSNEKGDQDSELAEEVRLANASGADMFLAVHLNAGGGTGTEAYTYTETTSKLAKDVCAKMSANVAAALGISNRGAKTANFYVLRKTTMPAVLLEVCFVDSATDRAAWNRTSWDALTKAVVDAIGGNAVTTQAEAGWVQDSKGWWHRNADGTWPKNTWKKIGGKWYWFGADGYAVHDCWKKLSGSWYYFDSSCAALQSTCAKIKGKWYAFDDGCHMKTSVRVNAGGDLAL